MAIERQRLLTYEDYAAIDDGNRYELINGELYMCASPSIFHQSLSGKLFIPLCTHVAVNGLGQVFYAPVDVVLDPVHRIHTVQPDILFVSNERSRIITDQNIQGAPDLVIEILSPGTEKRDFGEKKMLYARYGVKEYWIIWQDFPRIEVYRLGLGKRYGKPTLYEAGEELTTNLLPGFSVAVDSFYPHLKDDDPLED